MVRCLVIVFCSLMAVEAHARCIESEEAARLVAALFPTAALDRWQPSPGAKTCLQVGPVQRDGLWGFVDEAFVVPFPDGQKLVAFRLQVAMKSQSEAARLRSHNPMEQDNLDALEGMQVILLNRNGRFVAKPEGYPLLAPRNMGCMGDLCSTEGVILNRLAAVEGNDGAARIDFDHDGAHKLLLLLLRAGELLAREVKLGGVDDLSGCDKSTVVRGVRASKKYVTVQLEDQCNYEACPEECTGFSAKEPTQNRLVVLFRKK